MSKQSNTNTHGTVPKGPASRQGQMDTVSKNKQILFSLSPDDNCSDEVPCPDAVPQLSPGVVQRFRNCVIQKLHKQCARSLAGSWSVPENVDIQELRSCGLSNYLFSACLRDHVPVIAGEPRKVLIRVYGEVLRSSVDSIVLDSVNFAILSEKRIGPSLYGVFPGGRIEEFIESRPLLASELSIPKVMEAIARHTARIHRLNMPFCKQPTFLLKMMEKFLAQLTGAREPPSRPTPNLSKTSLAELQVEYDRHVTESDVGEWVTVGFLETQQMALQFRLCEEFAWLKAKFQESPKDMFPVVFCHNDLQENNILVLDKPGEEGTYELLPIDFEYAGYNYRAFDVGNHFNEWCYDYAIQDPPYYTYNYDLYPSREQQAFFWTAYFNADCVERNSSGDCGSPDTTNDHTSQLNGEHDFDKLWIETAYGSLYSHLFWAAWSLVQSQISSIRFRFNEYAASRMDAYHRLKKLVDCD